MISWGGNARMAGGSKSWGVMTSEGGGNRTGLGGVGLACPTLNDWEVSVSVAGGGDGGVTSGEITNSGTIANGNNNMSKPDQNSTRVDKPGG